MADRPKVTVTLIGAGGVEQVFDLPLGAAYAEQAVKGTLQPKTPADRKKLAASLGQSTPEPAENLAVEPTGDVDAPG